MSNSTLRELTDALILRDEKLRENENLLSVMFSMNPVAMILTSVSDGTIVKANKAFEELSGYTKEEMLGETTLHLYKNAEDRNRIIEIVKKDGGAKNVEIQFVRKDGRLIDGQISIKTIITDREECFLSTIMDITERNKAEVEIKRLASFPILNPNPIVEVTLDGVVTFCNPVAKQLFPDMCLGHKWFEKGQYLGLDIEIEHKSIIKEAHLNGRWYLQVFNFVKDAQVIRIYGIDITEQKANEDKLREKDEFYRTTREELVEAKQVAAEKEEVRIKLVETANALKQVAEEKEETRIKLVETAELLKQVADEKEEVRIKLVETAELLKQVAEEKEEARIKLVETAELLKQVAAEKLIKSEEKLVETSNALKQVAAEKEEVRLKLVETANALKQVADETMQFNKILLDALPCVAMLLHCETREIIAMNKTAEEAGCKIGQTCYGSWPKLDQPCSYCQAPEACTTYREKHAVVEVENVVWDIYWTPVSKDLLMHYAFDVTELKRAEKVLERLRETAGDTEVRKVLIIDDSKDYLNLLKTLLKEFIPECQVFTASNGEAGIEIAINEDPGVILLDIVMPGMDGFDVCKKLKENIKTRNIPVVFVTGHSDYKIQIQALNVGGEAFLSKSMSGQELVTQVRAMAKVKALHKVTLLDKELL